MAAFLCGRFFFALAELYLWSCTQLFAFRQVEDAETVTARGSGTLWCFSQLKFIHCQSDRVSRSVMCAKSANKRQLDDTSSCVLNNLLRFIHTIHLRASSYPARIFCTRPRSAKNLSQRIAHKSQDVFRFFSSSQATFNSIPAHFVSFLLLHFQFSLI